MSTLDDYARSHGPHFVLLTNVPVVSTRTTINDVLVLMRERRTQGVLVFEDRLRYRLVLQDHLSQLGLAARRMNPGRVTVSEAFGHAPVLPTLDASRPRADVWAVLAGSRPFRSVAVVMAGEVVGLHTETEDWYTAFYAAPAVYRCAEGHHWPPPPPAVCPVDGSAVSRA